MNPQFATYPSLRGRVVLITGGGSGIGATMVQAFAKQGAKVGFIDRDEAAAQVLLQPEHIARMVLFLASDDALMCTANNYMVEAGSI